jgi:hypothetical protein
MKTDYDPTDTTELKKLRDTIEKAAWIIATAHIVEAMGQPDTKDEGQRQQVCIGRFTDIYRLLRETDN